MGAAIYLYSFSSQRSRLTLSTGDFDW